MSDLNGAAHLFGTRPRVGTSFNALVRHLDADGTFEADSVRLLPDGNAMPTTRRDQYLDADDLIDAIRQAVREELAAALDKRIDS